jgi:hypothetical protein
MSDWTDTELVAAHERLVKRFHGESFRNSAAILQCEVTALREALEITLPLLKEEQEMYEHSFPPEPNAMEETILTTYSEVIERVESTLTAIPK